LWKPSREGSALGWKPPYGETTEDHPGAASLIRIAAKSVI